MKQETLPRAAETTKRLWLFSISRYVPAAMAAALLWFMAPKAFSQQIETGTVTGRVYDVAGDRYLYKASVKVAGTLIEALTDESGGFRLRNVPAGTVQIQARYPGLPETAASVVITAGGTANLDINLAGSVPDTSGKVVELEKFSVVEQREMSARNMAINEQRTAANIKNVVAFDEYGYTTDGNLGEFLKHIPGVSVDYSASIPVGVSVRGMPGSTTSIMSDGMMLAGGETTSATRASSLSMVGTDNISRIEVTKVPTPDQPASGIGGSINIISNSALSRRKPLLTFNAYSTFRGDYPWELSGRDIGMPIPLLGGTQTAAHILPSFNFTYLRPVNDKLAISVSGSQILRYIHNDTTIAAWNASTLLQTTARYRAVPQVATIRSGQLKVDYKLSPNSLLSASYQARERAGSQAVADVFVSSYGTGVTGGPSFTQGTGGGTLQQTNGFIQRDNSNQTASLKYEFKGRDYKFDAGYSFSSTLVQNYDNDGYTGTTVANLTGLAIRGDGIAPDPDKLGSNVPARLTVTSGGLPVDWGDGNLYSLASVTNTDLNFRNTRQGFSVNLQRDFGTSGLTMLKFGFLLSEERQRADWNTKGYNFRSGATAAVRQASLYNIVDPGLFSYLPEIAGASIRRISPTLVYRLVQTNPEYFTEQPANAQNKINNTFRVKEDVSAAYIRADFRLLENRLNIVTGARYEHTSDKTKGPLRNQLLGLSSEGDYDGIYPSLNASYQLTERFTARLAYARTIARPDMAFIMPRAAVATADNANGQREITVVETGLTPWTANNYDLSLETYLSKDSYGSISFFQKDIDDFFGLSSRPATPAEVTLYGGDPALTNYVIVQRRNAGAARIRGFELGYRHTLTFLPDWARGFQVFVNYTRLELDGTAIADFSGFNPETLSYGFNFVRPRFSLKFNMSYLGETRREPTGSTGDYFWAGTKNRDTISAEYSLTKRLSLYGQVTDLIGGGYIDVQKQYNPNNPVPDYARYQRLIGTGTEVTLGIKGRF
jgi:iron complex outermembrane receptor protein